MKFVLCLSVLWLVTPLGQAADSAYSALRVVGGRMDAQAMNRVIEVRGSGGVPVPTAWKILVKDTKAGVREMVVQNGKVVSERTLPAAGDAGPMNFTQLNLDSEGAFTIVNEEAEKAGFPFDRVDYLLKSGTRGGAPVWDLKLSFGKSKNRASVLLAADTGNVLHKEGLVAPPPPVDPNQVASDRAFVDGETKSRAESTPHVTTDKYGNIIQRTRRHFERRGHQIKRFFTGD